MGISSDLYEESFRPEDYIERKKARMHPTPEQILFRMAVEKALSNKQRKVWEYWNYDRLTQPEIAKKLRVKQQAVSQQIATIEKQLAKWIQEHAEVYKTLQLDYGANGDV